MIIFIDLDGPILDVSPRYVALHRDLLRALGARGMAGDLYWRRKRARIPEERILEELGASEHIADYLRRRLELIETRDYLVHDRCWPWAESTLSGLSTQGPL